MGQKVNPNGIRLGIVKEFSALWYVDKKAFADTLHSDLKVRKFLEKKLSQAAVSRIKIERPARNVKVTVESARPGIIIGEKGKDIETLRSDITKIVGVPAQVDIKEIRKPELDAKLVAESIAQQLQRRVMFRRAMKRAVTTAMRLGAKGIKVMISGRIGGAEIARSESYREGRVPLHTFRADIDYATAQSLTTYGIIGVKVWIFKGEVLGGQQVSEEETTQQQKTGKKEK